MRTIPQHKKDTVAEFTGLIEKYPILGVVDLKGLQTKQLQHMRVSLRDMALIRMTKKRLMKLAFKNTKRKGIEGLESYLNGIPALLFTSENPFKLYKILEKNKSNAPAKAGDIAPKDIIVKAGPTGFTPGPVIGQLGKFGIKTGVDAGKIVIKEDKKVASRGDKISQELAEILGRLSIHPMEVGLNLVAVFEDGAVYASHILAVDEKAYLGKLGLAYTESLNLSVYAAIPTPENLDALLSKAYSDAKSLSVGLGILTSDNVGDMIAKAVAEMTAVAMALPEGARPEGLDIKTESSSSPQSKAHKKEEPEEKKDSAAGLSSLFG